MIFIKICDIIIIENKWKWAKILKKEFLDFLTALMEAAPDVAERLMTDNVKAYIDILKDVKDEKPVVTENGQQILK